MSKLGFAELNGMTPYQVLENEIVKERFVSLYEKLHHSKMGEVFYEKEKYNFIRVIQASDDLQRCTGFSIYGCFLDVAALNLSLEQTSKPMLYVLFYNRNVGTKDNAQWEKRATLEVSPYGELALRINAGQLRHADHPVIIYKGDIFQPGESDGKKTVHYLPKIPRESKEIVGGYIGLTRADGSREYFWMLQDDIERLKGYSNKKNRGDVQNDKSNALYTSNGGQIDTGFLEAKIIKHAFSTFPKIKTGEFSKLTEEEPDPINYGLDDKPVHSQAAPSAVNPVQERQEEPKPEPEAFGDEQARDDEDGVVIEDDSETF